MTDTFTTGHTLPTAITTENAVLRLRQQRLAAATRAYRARGCRAIRCQNCLLAERFCLCDTIKPQQANSRFCLIMFDTEPLKPSNTGRLIADILPDTHAFLWARTEVDPELLAAISDPLRQPYVVFPEAYAEPERQVINQLPISDKPPLFILLDGTWTEAKKMFRKSPYLAGLPLLSLQVSHLSDYQLREAQRPEQHCTVEVATALLHQAGDIQAAEGLRDHFHYFRQQYLAGKPHHPVGRVTAGHEENA
ncbi:DTW domain protein [Yersinia pseudotuberculosis IP 32953]|uniref:tRNA-uridine aminocarboxypropyltransferase n=4 Tax=Yersinia pseudotuberculosis complex TaxID=1649845 RepID=A0A0T9JWJ6_YERPU|nr:MULTISPECIES: tRNA-uridine aminocarboxypropyltransferase [Yersinia pseudotuberculosis complex]AJJ55198.1 DTW domain protein [Yersinia pseudotuberculosis IP 32953]AYW90285.1 DTW domain-containing protein [Yersinia pseudotuberculosis]AYW94749.1 DTW domain-containing protein [Yersinia pseudotuberculosis]KGA65107.1 DTW domain protein [Yersinia pseudotuberculosis]MBO1632508.1 DTW domain-containing protein [Yersinia pseudotuberculosis]